MGQGRWELAGREAPPGEPRDELALPAAHATHVPKAEAVPKPIVSRHHLSGNLEQQQ